MDPNVTLVSIRKLITDLHRCNDRTELFELAEELAYTTTDLDEWLTKGGFLPAAWTTNRTED